MKKVSVIGLILILLTFYQFSFSQNLDLIVRVNGDSIACRIDSITDSQIYFDVKNSNKWIHVDISKDMVTEFQYNVINPDFYDFKSGTSYIKSKRKYPNYTPQNMQSSSLEELELYLIKAKKIKKNGAVLSIAGPLSAAIGFWMFSASWSGSFGNGFTAGLGSVLFLVGSGATIVGIPILLTGSSRVKKIERIKNSKNTGIFIELTPCSFQNNLVQNYQPGVTLRIRF